MDPRQECPFPACSSPSKPARTPHETNLILTVLAGPGNREKVTVSGFIEGVTGKGPLIACFSWFLSRISIFDPFPRFHWIRCQKGPDPVVPGSIRCQKGPGCCPSEALRALPALSNGYLDLSNTCPGCSRAASGYRVRTAEDTGTEEELRSSVTFPPGGYWPAEPRRPPVHRGRTGR